MHSRDKIAQHLTQQKAQSFRSTRGFCAYRGQDGAMCAIGCLIPDEKYDAAMEGAGTSGLRERFPGVLPNDTCAEELAQWQRYHDTAAFIYDNQNTRFRFSYRSWIEGNEAHSPDEFKQAMFVQFNKEGVVA